MEANMANPNKKWLTAGLVLVFLLAGTAAVSAYITRESVKSQATAKTHVKPQHIASAQPQQPMQPRCDDKNIVGTIAGGAAGGIVGSQIGQGKGKTAATIGGVVGGAYLGNEYLPTRNVTCR
jgi:outer membrane lipoprotein SlyB